METSLVREEPLLLSRSDFETMLEFSRSVFRLKDNPAYLSTLAPLLPETARIPTPWPSVLMGFDFHLTADGPKLIEINNNAGGLYVGGGRWLPQSDLAVAGVSGTLEERLLGMFPDEWKRIAIMDEDIENQFMYPEMCAYAELLRQGGRKVWLCSPENLQSGEGGLYAEGERIDAIYNRHTDFYLEDVSLRHIRAAYERGQVVLNPHPRSYALIGDKSRMADWWEPGLLEGCVDPQTVALIRRVTPETRYLAELDADQVWSERSQWVFKPLARHGGKGVVIGKGISRKRFNELDAGDTIIQQLVPASEVVINGRQLKLDLRLYMHGSKLIALAGRVWSGQVTNFREPGSGWVSLAIEG